MKLLLLLLVSAFATNCWAEDEDNAAENEEFYCITTCRDGENCTVGIKTKEIEKQICPSGNAMDETGNCIPDDQCPHEACGKNQVFDLRNRVPMVYCNGTVDRNGTSGRCPCKKNYAMNDEGKCVTYQNCKTVKCNKNGKYTTSFGYHERKCGQEEIYHMEEYYLRCECKRHFVEKSPGNCVHLRNCPNDLKAADRGRECEDVYSDTEDPLFYFDSAKKRCLAFNYKGCGGNSNNFLRQTLCEEIFARDLTKKEFAPKCAPDAGELVMHTENMFSNGTQPPPKPLFGRQCSDEFCPTGSTCHDDTRKGLSFCCKKTESEIAAC